MKINITSSHQEKLWLSPSEVSQMTGLSKGSVYTLFRSRSFPSCRVGRRWLVSRDKLQKYLAEQEEKHASDTYAD